MKRIFLACVLVLSALSINAQDFFQEAYQAYFNADFEKAAELYSNYIIQHPSSYAAYYNRGLAYFYANQYFKAKNDFNKSIQLCPQDKTDFIDDAKRKLEEAESLEKHIEYSVFNSADDGGKENEKPPLPVNPPILEITDITFVDENKNNAINAGEADQILFNIKNLGKGIAREVEVNVIEKNNLKGITYSKLIRVGDIESNNSKNVKISIKSNLDIISDTAYFMIKANELNGFIPDPVYLEILTQKYIPPQITIVDHKFSSEAGGKIEKGYPISLKMAVQNIGYGLAENVKLDIILEENVFSAGEKEYDLGDLGPGVYKEIDFEFFTNKVYSKDEINITTVLHEKNKKFGDTQSFTVSINDKLDKTTKITITAQIQEQQSINIKKVTYTSSVDKEIPVNKQKPNRIALIIGNEDYTSFQAGLSNESNVDFAINDATVFKEYAIKTLGVIEKNCFLITNATAGVMNQHIDLIVKLASRIENAEIIFYYAGHGLPDENTRVPYLIPVDINYSNLNSAISLNDLYEELAGTNASRITIFLDACFSGGGREAGLLAARAVKIKPKEVSMKGNIVVFSATSNEQSALPYKEEFHGMFTYFLLKKIQESKGNVDYETLGKYIQENVSIESLRINKKEQEPDVIYSSELDDGWHKWLLNE